MKNINKSFLNVNNGENVISNSQLQQNPYVDKILKSRYSGRKESNRLQKKRDSLMSSVLRPKTKSTEKR
jgi:hypothetical protein